MFIFQGIFWMVLSARAPLLVFYPEIDTEFLIAVSSVYGGLARI